MRQYRILKNAVENNERLANDYRKSELEYGW
jgi:hypothetical protein